jgi:hypothetical protein
MNGEEFGLANIEDAAVLCEKLLGYGRDGLNFHPDSMDSPRSSLSELEEKEAAIQRLQLEYQQVTTKQRERIAELNQTAIRCHREIKRLAQLVHERGLKARLWRALGFRRRVAST